MLSKKHRCTKVNRITTMGRCYDRDFLRFFDNFLRQNWRFSQKSMLWSKFCIIWLCFESKTPIFSQTFLRKYFKNHNIGPMSAHGSRCGSAVKWWNEKINEIKRSQVHSPARATFLKKERKKTCQHTRDDWLFCKICTYRHSKAVK
jgi:hypothetical protein